MADSTVDPIEVFNAQVEAEQESERHWTAFDLMTEFAACGVTYADARAALDKCQWSVKRARNKLRARCESQPA